MSRKRSKREESFVDKLPLALKTGKVNLGFKESLKSLVEKKTKLLILTSNFSPIKRKTLEYYAAISNNTPIYYYDGSNNDLSKNCGKYFRIGVISIQDFGEADLMNAMAQA
ncbi:60S ribosomal protein L3 [Spraguea lophii 42_110]|uniref:60S ribosomal protein L3 n=1 Tax=Spraguea lophii (strain 42_110) TaxID=1358809 RepID=S7WAY0_SPRLO|nr:Chain LCC, 60S ribosomal protein L3 [Spraguea lophii 42_110]7QJH_KCC Chain KCC, 60S ribosomal protein L3 [Spraguea lophii 42_110]7QJH_LCC Chain LCC, 60S ribosomal protein L3 [Spraguea lophii 42_110]8BR3_LCC Chain LCC, 60S ribosomal protein L3 [Spraguea lophii 42_110]8P5D_LCC Chain LCC, 60S ribosomal protein L3 [Spraguea lophii 42_110]8P60_KCC Chain KCC, 60S ribosomal protein L3 [Spraguea lophii 42_110]8P60_LCC Chain LCC, 60S ribosomal protein L3 [Spraguea lophii 42_110]EPR80081.1 60S ribo